jgi:hypothetical protein
MKIPIWHRSPEKKNEEEYKLLSFNHSHKNKLSRRYRHANQTQNIDDEIAQKHTTAQKSTDSIQGIQNNIKERKAPLNE